MHRGLGAIYTSSPHYVSASCFAPLPSVLKVTAEAATTVTASATGSIDGFGPGKTTVRAPSTTGTQRVKRLAGQLGPNFDC